MENSKDEVREKTIQELLSPYRQALLGHGIGPELLARQRKQQLNAKFKTPIKVKGELPAGARLAPGYRIITPGGVTLSEKGRMIFDDAIIEHTTPNWQIQERATSALEKIFDEPQKQIVEHTGSITMTNFPPEPQTMEEWESMYQKMKDNKKHDPNDPNSTPGT